MATLPDGRRLSGTVTGVHGATLVISNFGKVNPKRRFRTWLTYLLLAAAHPDEEFRGVLVGRQATVPLGPIGSDEACRSLADLVRLHELGLREPLPIALKTSFEYASARRKGAVAGEALKGAARSWESRGRYPGENREPAHEQIYGPDPDITALTADAPGSDDEAGLWPDEPTRFGVFSRRWWDPMLDAERRAP